MEPLQPTTVRQRTYTGQAISVLGQVPVKVRYGQKNYLLSVLVVEGEGPNLMGRNWLRELKVTLGQIHSIEESSALNNILKKHSPMSLQGTKVNLHTNSQVNPKFYKAHSVPLALKER